MKEAPTLKRILLKASELGAVVFRQNVGVGWVGEVVSQVGKHLTLREPRPLAAGLCKGSSDVIGWMPVTITPEMVGRKVAVFAAIEAKGHRGRASNDQKRFIERVIADGGFAGVAHSADEVHQILFPTSTN